MIVSSARTGAIIGAIIIMAYFLIIDALFRMNSPLVTVLIIFFVPCFEEAIKLIAFSSAKWIILPCALLALFFGIIERLYRLEFFYDAHWEDALPVVFHVANSIAAVYLKNKFSTRLVFFLCVAIHYLYNAVIVLIFKI